jgi:hypothetical protein
VKTSGVLFLPCAAGYTPCDRERSDGTRLDLETKKFDKQIHKRKKCVVKSTENAMRISFQAEKKTQFRKAMKWIA